MSGQLATSSLSVTLDPCPRPALSLSGAFELESPPMSGIKLKQASCGRGSETEPAAAPSPRSLSVPGTTNLLWAHQYSSASACSDRKRVSRLLAPAYLGELACGHASCMLLAVYGMHAECIRPAGCGWPVSGKPPPVVCVRA